MTANGLDLHVLRAEVAQLRREKEQEAQTRMLLTCLLSAIADKEGGTVRVNGFRFEAMAGRAFQINRPKRSDDAPNDPTDITFTLLPEATGDTKTEAAKPALRIVTE